MRFEELTAEEQAWVVADEVLWRKARALVERHPDLDVAGVYHTLVNLRRTPDERLARSLAIARAYREAASR